jgi:hypothetical protein
MLTTPLPSDPEVQAQFDPRTNSAQVFLVYGEPGTEDQSEAGAEAESGAGSESPAAPREPAGAGPETETEGTPTGRDASRRNALKDGMTAKVVFPPELAAEVARCTAMLTDVYKPSNVYEIKLIGDMGRAGAQLELIAKQKIGDYSRSVDRAIDHWDDDRETYVADLAARLPEDPSRVAKALRKTKQGLELLLGKWETLEAILEHRGEWTEEQRQFAYDLLGVDHALREGNPIVPAGTDQEELAALVAAEIAALKTLRDASLEPDERDRNYAMAGMPMEEDATTRKLRRNERDARRDYNTARTELFRVRAEAAAQAQAASPAAGAQSQAKPEAPIPPRPPLSEAAAAFLAERTRMAATMKKVVHPEPAPAPAATTPQPEPAPAAAVKETAPTKPLPRRVRKEMAKKAREKARQEARQAARQ